MAQIPADVSPGDSGHDDHHDALHGLYNHLDTVGGGDVTAAWTAAEKSKLAAIEALATADQTGAQIKTAYEAEADTNAFDDAAVSKLAGIEALADVTDTANVTAAGALMDSEVDADLKTLSLPASTTISAFGASLIDDADAAAARTTLGVGGTTRNSQTHSSAGALSVTRAGADQSTVVTVSANITSWTNNLTVDLDILQFYLLGDGGTTDYTADLSTLGLGTVNIYPDTELEIIVQKRGANLWTDIAVRAAGTSVNLFSVVGSGELAYNSGTTFVIPTIEDGDILLVAVTAAGTGDPGAATATGPTSGALTELYSEWPEASNFEPRQTLLSLVLDKTNDEGDTVTVSPGALAHSIGWVIVRGLTSVSTTTPAPTLNSGSTPAGIVFTAITTANAGDVVFIHGSSNSGAPVAGDLSSLSDGGFTAVLTQLDNGRGQILAYQQIAVAGTVTPGTLKDTGDSFYDQWVASAFVVLK